ncbi:hypothetical protein [Microbacterium sp. CH-015]|uniref:hypothetical protein n=1 Tax=Microbacterium sp. CH-015 TaxID=3406734 RepID=UPI003C790F4B
MYTLAFLTPLEVAIEYDKDWDLWWWIGAGVVGVVAITIALTVIPLWGWTDRFDSEVGVLIGRIVLAVLALAAAYTLVVLPGTMMRHVQAHENVWWVVIGWLVGGVALITISREYGWLRWLAPSLVGAGLLIGAANDALQRFASWIPTTAAAVLAIIILGIGLLWLKSR